jgi:hypothetical protein
MMFVYYALPLLLLLALLITSAEGKAVEFKCPQYPRLAAGVSVHGMPMEIDGSRSIRVYRDGQVLHHGDLYFVGESLLVTINDTSGVPDVVLEANCSTCSFRFGICPSKYRFTGSIGSLTMPVDYTPIEIQVQYCALYNFYTV